MVNESDNGNNDLDTNKSSRKYIEKKSNYSRPSRVRNYNKRKVNNNDSGQSQEVANS